MSTTASTAGTALGSVTRELVCEVAEVAGQEPAVVERGSGRLLVVEVALHDARAPHRHLADMSLRDGSPLRVDDLDLDVFDRAADRRERADPLRRMRVPDRHGAPLVLELGAVDRVEARAAV